MKTTLLILFISSAFQAAFAQFTISGKVVNKADNKPVESATVFVNKTSYATKTDKRGNFIIKNVQLGHYELIVSMIGFKTNKLSISIQSDIKVPLIQIEERTISLGEVKITNLRRVDSKYLDMFKREILGLSKFGRQCRILNTKVIKLNFDKGENKLMAYTTDFMVIDNKALGYRLKYLVEDFERNEKTELISYVGYVLFEALQGDDQQRREWTENRREAYTGSLQHFLRSLLGNNINKVEEPGFLVATDTRSLNKRRQPDSLIKEKIRTYSGKFSRTDKDSLFFWTNMFEQPRYVEVIDTTKLSAKEIVQLTDQKGLYALQINTDSNYIKKWGLISIPGVKGRRRFTCDTCQFKNSLYVTYVKRIPKKLGISYRTINFSKAESFTPTPDMNKMASLLSIFDGHVIFDWNGVIVNPLSLKLERYWANLRLGDLLPIDYIPLDDNHIM